MRPTNVAAARRSAAEPRLSLVVQYATQGDDLPDRGRIRRWVAAAIDGRRRRAALTVRIVGEAEGRALNRRWRGRHRATNVLAFPGGGGPGVDPDFLGEIVVCAPVVRAEARAQRKTPHAHWAHLMVHGTLHLLGYDHDVPHRAAEMEQLERALLARFGHPDPYAAGPGR